MIRLGTLYQPLAPRLAKHPAAIVAALSAPPPRLVRALSADIVSVCVVDRAHIARQHARQTRYSTEAHPAASGSGSGSGLAWRSCSPPGSTWAAPQLQRALPASERAEARPGAALQVQLIKSCAAPQAVEISNH